MINPYRILDIANKAFGFSPSYTLWGISYQNLNSLMIEAAFRNKEMAVLKDEFGEYEWKEREDFDGKIQRYKEYKDPTIDLRDANRRSKQ